jgi:hypothetical protein
MSHFTCLIVAATEEEAQEVLLPYHEYGWGADLGDKEEPYLEFVVVVEAGEFESKAREMIDAHKKSDRLQKAKVKRWKKKIQEEVSQGLTFEDMKKKHKRGYGEVIFRFAKDLPRVLERMNDTIKGIDERKERYEGLEAQYREGAYEAIFSEFEGGSKNEKTGDWGYLHNPNAKWDWFTPGGRWSGLFDQYAANPLFPVGDVFQKKSIDWDAARKEKTQDKIDWRNKMWNKLDVIGGAKIVDGELVTNKGFAGRLIDKMDEVSEIKDDDPDAWDDWVDFRIQLGTISSREVRILSMIPEQIEREFSEISLTYAIVDKDGVWFEQAQMYYFGISGDENSGYDRVFWEFIDELDDEDWLMLIDCHI